VCLYISARHIFSTLHDADGEYASSMDVAFLSCMSPLTTILHLIFPRAPWLSSFILLVYMVSFTGSLASSMEVFLRVPLSMISFNSLLRALSHPFIFLASFVHVISIALRGGGKYIIG
jgi:hypothetical protein